jgi:DNA adenine methylase
LVALLEEFILSKKKLHLPLKWHGGKRYLASRILDLFPKHLHYCEPFAGGLAVLLTRDPDDPRFWMGTGGSNKGVSEIVNDIDHLLANFWRVLGSPALFPEFFRRVTMIPLGREFWQEASEESTDDSVTAAVAFFVHCRQSRAGMRKDFTSLTRNRTRRGMNGNVSEWLGAVDGLPDVHQRLRLVAVENMDAVKFIRREDEPTTLFYCDPPYLASTRAAPDAYRFEMTEQQHRELLETLLACRGKVILSGYPSALYDTMLKGWHVVDVDIANHAAGGQSKRRMTERLWFNYRDETARTNPPGCLF